MTALPDKTPYTVPLMTLATEGSLLIHVTSVKVALFGVRVGIRERLSPTESILAVSFSVTAVTAMGLTVTAHWAATGSASAWQVMTALPMPTVVTCPPLTTATEVSLLDQVTSG